MEREKVIEIFLGKGLMLDSESLEFFCKNSDQIEIFLNKIKTMEKPPIIKLDFIKSFLEEKELKIEEIKKKDLEKNIFSIEDISKILLDRYEKIKSFFSYRMDIVNLISINKINERTKKFSIIAMIKEIDRKNKNVVVEDLTGEISLSSKNNIFDLLVQDEVLGFVCEKINDKIEALNILWPDIPLKRKISNLEENVYCMFISEKQLKNNEEKVLEEISKISFKKFLVFLFFESYDKKQIENFKNKLPINTKLILITREKIESETISCFSSPVFLLIEDKVNLLLCDGKMFSFYEGVLGEKTEEIMLNLLKKRHLDPNFTVEKALEENRLLIDPVPDIFVSFDFGTSGLINYKGTTIISCGSFEKICWIVNLKTRESLKINLT